MQIRKEVLKLRDMKREKKEQFSKTAASGIVALVFLVLGFQLAVFTLKIIERPNAREAAGGVPSSEHFPAGDTVTGAAVRAEELPPARESQARTKLGGYPRREKQYAAPRPASDRTFESFAFDPNSVSLEDLQRLGLSERQAQSIENYRAKGGRFRKKEDFAKMYAVSDTLYARLEPYIEIPRIELNAADSAALVSLKGIGPWYARKILDYRGRLGGFVAPEQLLEIEGMDEERYAGLAEAVMVDTSLVRKIDLWLAPDTLLASHPYLGTKGARSILRYRSLFDTAQWSLPHLQSQHVFPPETIEKLKKYIVIQ